MMPAFLTQIILMPNNTIEGRYKLFLQKHFDSFIWNELNSCQSYGTSTHCWLFQIIKWFCVVTLSLGRAAFQQAYLIRTIETLNIIRNLKYVKSTFNWLATSGKKKKFCYPLSLIFFSFSLSQSWKCLMLSMMTKSLLNPHGPLFYSGNEGPLQSN